MSFPEDEQQPGPAVEQAPEPRLLTRSDRQTTSQAADRAPEQAASPKPRTPRKRHHHRGRRTAARMKHVQRIKVWSGVALALVMLLLVTAAAIVGYLRHAATAALPQLDGQVQAKGLRAPVTVARDAQGVPTITAANLSDLLFAQGYITAGDRLWQMDALRRHAAGELAEVLGSAMIEHDRRQRYLQIRAAADRAVTQLPADQLTQLEAYAHGVNAYIDTHSSAMPLEFRLLAYKPAPWTPRDSLLVSLAMWQDLSTDFPQKMDREALSAHLPAALVPDLYPVGSWRDHPPADQGRDLTAPHIVEQIPLDPSQSRLQKPTPRAGATAQELLAVSTALAGTGRCEGCRSGSNNWAVSGAHTASGAPLVSNDMHLSLSVPDIWYEASLHADLSGDGASGATTPRLDVTGFTLPGVPFVIVGRNARVAWGVTNLGADVQDLRVEHLRGSGDATEYERPDGSWAAATHHAETIRVRNGRNVVLDVLSTQHAAGASTMDTPVISPLYRGEARALSLAWTAYDPVALSSPFLGVNAATDGASLVAALAHFGGPALNLVWADADGHIGYHALGYIPVRGPAVQHPRAVTAPVVEPGAAPPDEGDEPAPEVSLTGTTSHFVLSAFQRGPRRRFYAPVAPARRQARVRPRAVAPPRTQVRAQPRAQAPVDEAPVAATPVLNYTIGSPISPVAVDALDASQAWSEYVPYDALPATVDPRNGYLATANARITGDDYPYALAIDWADPFRVDRIVYLLDGRKGLTPEAMLQMEMDVHSDVNQALAQRLAYAVDHANATGRASDAGRLREAANLLRAWDGEMRVGSPAAAIVESVRKELWPALLVPQLEAHGGVTADQAASLVALYTWGERGSALELMVQHAPARWLPKGVSNWNDFLTMNLDLAMRQAHAPGNLAKWQYGQVHQVKIEHPVFGAHPLLSQLLGVPAGSGERPAPGDATTVDAMGAQFGPSERFTADLSSTDAALGNITTGESGNPQSPWYFDQFHAWLAGQSFALPGSGTEATHTLTLLP